MGISLFKDSQDHSDHLSNSNKIGHNMKKHLLE